MTSQEQDHDATRGFMHQLTVLTRYETASLDAFKGALDRAIDGGFAPLYPYEAYSEIMVAGSSSLMRIRVSAQVSFDERKRKVNNG